MGRPLLAGSEGSERARCAGRQRRWCCVTLTESNGQGRCSSQGGGCWLLCAASSSSGSAGRAGGGIASLLTRVVVGVGGGGGNLAVLGLVRLRSAVRQQQDLLREIFEHCFRRASEVLLLTRVAAAARRLGCLGGCGCGRLRLPGLALAQSRRAAGLVYLPGRTAWLAGRLAFRGFLPASECRCR